MESTTVQDTSYQDRACPRYCLGSCSRISKARTKRLFSGITEPPSAAQPPHEITSRPTYPVCVLVYTPLPSLFYTRYLIHKYGISLVTLVVFISTGIYRIRLLVYTTLITSSTVDCSADVTVAMHAAVPHVAAVLVRTIVSPLSNDFACADPRQPADQDRPNGLLSNSCGR